MPEGCPLVGQGQRCWWQAQAGRGQADKSLPLVGSKSQACQPLGLTEQGERVSLQHRGNTAKDREGH